MRSAGRSRFGAKLWTPPRAADAERASTLRSLADSLGAVAEHAAARAAAAERVDANLHALHESGRFGEAVHALTAAVHLLTARAGAAPAGPAAVPFPAPARRAA